MKSSLNASRWLVNIFLQWTLPGVQVLFAAMMLVSCRSSEGDSEAISTYTPRSESAETIFTSTAQAEGFRNADKPKGKSITSLLKPSEWFSTPQFHPTSGRHPTIPAPTVTLLPDSWQSWPVIPHVSDTARKIYQRGMALGNNSHAFSKIGDCQNVPSMFLAVFDYPGQYTLGAEYAYLSEAIEWFSGSFSRESQSVRSGFNAASIISPMWADPDFCKPSETPLDCEVRIHKPSIAIISLETWWEGDPSAYEKYLRQIIEITIGYGVVPILATKADNLEGDHRINAILARLASEYDIPLWNFWLVVQPLPNHGLLEDDFHLTFATNQFDAPEAMQAAWPWRNLTALQALDAIWREVSDQ